MNNIRTQQTEGSITDSLLCQQYEHAEELADEMARSFWPMIGTANQCAFMAIDDAVDMMRECGMLRQQVKVNAQRAVEEFEKYDRAVYRHFHELGDERYYLWSDLIIRSAQALQPDVDKLYSSIKNIIDKHGCRNSDVLSKIQTALALVTLSTLMFDTMFEQFQRQTMFRLDKTFNGGRLTAVESNWKQVGYLTGRQGMQVVDLANDPTCQLAVQNILNRYSKADFINDAAGEALKLNPECLKLVKPIS